MIRVLLIEDDADDVELARRAFEKVQVADQIRVARNGQIAMDYLFGEGTYAGQGTPSSLGLILLDLKLPVIDGLTLLGQIRTHPATRTIPVVILTVSREEPDLIQSFSMGANDYLIKPIRADHFGEMYRKYIKGVTA